MAMVESGSIHGIHHLPATDGFPSYFRLLYTDGLRKSPAISSSVFGFDRRYFFDRCHTGHATFLAIIQRSDLVDIVYLYKVDVYQMVIGLPSRLCTEQELTRPVTKKANRMRESL